MNYHVALIVGRFQPFHKGHLFLVKKALENADKIIVGIGSANILDVNNPIDYETRGKVIKAVFYKEGIEEKLAKIVPLDDFFDDKKWVSNLKKQVGKFDLALGNNKWTNNILKKAGFKVFEVDYYKRPLYEGWRIRKLIQEGKKWQDRVPKYLISNIKDQISNKHIKDKRFNHVVLGGTFDHFHKGHEALLSKAFEIGKKITVGIATAELYKDKFLSETVETFEKRKKFVKRFIKNADIIPFSEFTGGTDKIKEIDAIVVSRETYLNAMRINKLRIKNKLLPLMIVIIEDILAEDGKLISSERIRTGEIDREGQVYKIPALPIGRQNLKSKIQEIVMPESIRPILQKPLGKVYKTTKQLVQAFESSSHPLLIAVGDIIVDSLLKEKIDPDVKIIDFKTRRKEFQISNFKFLIKSKFLNLKFQNKQGTINLKTAEVIKEKIQLALYKKEKSWIVVEGEEDLLTLPAILFAPLRSLVMYGHWQHGIVTVEVDEAIKKKARELLSRFI